MGNGSTPDVRAYLHSWGLELAARQNRVRHLIGDAHWLSDGHHKETILRDFLSRYLPEEAECSTGFVRNAASNERCSPEIDVLIFSRKVHVPYFSEGNLSIVDPSCVLANLEVKSSFSAETLKNAVENVARTRELISGAAAVSNLWSGILFYDLPLGRTLESAVQTLGEVLTANVPNHDGNRLMPTCLVLGQSCLAFPTKTSENIKIRAFEGQGLAFASAICDLLSSITTQVGGLRHSGFEDWAASTEFRMFEKLF